MYRFAGAVLVIAGCSYYGWMLGLRILKRISLVDEFIRNLESLSSMVEYSLDELSEAFYELNSQTTISELSELYNGVSTALKAYESMSFKEVWIDELEKYMPEYIKKGCEYPAIQRISQISGFIDKDSQLKVINRAVDELKTIRNRIVSELSPKVKIYRVTGITIGLLIVISLI